MKINKLTKAISTIKAYLSKSEIEVDSLFSFANDIYLNLELYDSFKKSPSDILDRYNLRKHGFTEESPEIILLLTLSE